jgi:hypothetical protein
MDGIIQAASMTPEGGQSAYAISRAIAALKPAIGECDPPKGGGSTPRSALSGRRGMRPGETNQKAARRCCAGRGTGAFYQGNLPLH